MRTRVALVLVLGLMLPLAQTAPAREGKPAPPPEKGPRIVVDPPEWDFGKALQNRTLSKTFLVRNVGSEELLIERVSTTCGCTVAAGYASRIKPGESTNLEVQLQTRSYAGRLARKVLIRSNDPENDPLTLSVQALVVPEP